MSSESVYEINVPFSRYVRGVRVHSIKASTEEEALEKVRNCDYGDACVKTYTHRDDIEEDYEDAYI